MAHGDSQHRWRLLAIALAMLAVVAAASVAEAGDRGDLLVWLHTPEGARSYRLVAADGFRAQDLGLGIRIAVDGAVMRVQHIEERAPRYRCVWNPTTEMGEDRAIRGQFVRDMRLEVVDARGRARVLIESMADDGFTFMANRSRVHASIGPYVAVRMRVNMGVCGARAFYNLVWLWFDLRTGARVPLVDELHAAPADVTVAASNLRAQWARWLLRWEHLSTAELDAQLRGYDEREVYPMGIIPVLERGRWRSSALLSMSMGDALGMTFAVAPIGDLGPRFAGHDVVPARVLRFVAQNPGTALGGFSRL